MMFTVADGVVTTTVIGIVVTTTMPTAIITGIITAMIIGIERIGSVMITRAEATGVVIVHNLIKITVVMTEVTTSRNRRIITKEAVTGVTMVTAVNSLKLQTQDKAALPVQDYKIISLP
jgi:hypothetical protein